jgi:hypothetical protein
VRPTLGRAPTSAPPAQRPVERVLLIVVALALVSGWVWLSLGPTRVPVSVHNPGSCTVWVAVSGADGQSSINLGPVPAGAVRSEPRLPDRGAVYLFRFSVNGAAAGSESVNRAALEADGWRYELPTRPELNLSSCDTA